MFVGVNLRQTFQFTVPHPTVIRNVLFFPFNVQQKSRNVFIETQTRAGRTECLTTGDVSLNPAGEKHLALFLIERRLGAEIPAAVTS